MEAEEVNVLQSKKKYLLRVSMNRIYDAQKKCYQCVPFHKHNFVS